MRAGALVLAVAFVMAAPVFAVPALADDAADCMDGIAMIRVEIAKAPAEPTRARLETALRVAEREQKEGEFDECLDAVGDARRAMR